MIMNPVQFDCKGHLGYGTGFLMAGPQVVTVLEDGSLYLEGWCSNCPIVRQCSEATFEEAAFEGVPVAPGDPYYREVTEKNFQRGLQTRAMMSGMTTSNGFVRLEVL